MRIAIAGLALLVGLGTTPVWSQTAPVSDILTALRAGGYVIVARHGATHTDQADTDPLNLDYVVRQRQLNDKGRADARALGEVLKAAGVPVGQAYSSRFSRAVETARLIAGKEPVTTLDFTEGGLVVSPNENNRRAQAILDAFDRDWFEIREGEASIFKPAGDGTFSLVGRVQINQWAVSK